MTTRGSALTLTGVLFAILAASEAAAQDTGSLVERASRSRVKGNDEAPVFVYEFADFQCPHCARFAIEIFPRIDSAFVETGMVRWVFVNLPLPTHANAWVAHEAAVCAGAVAGKFWPMHDRVFASQDEWMRAAQPGVIFDRLAREVGVPADTFSDCTSADRAAALILQDVIFAVSAGVNGTPAFNINDEQSVMGLKTFEEWTELLERAVKARARER